MNVPGERLGNGEIDGLVERGALAVRLPLATWLGGIAHALKRARPSNVVAARILLTSVALAV